MLLLSLAMVASHRLELGTNISAVTNKPGSLSGHGHPDDVVLMLRAKYQQRAQRQAHPHCKAEARPKLLGMEAWNILS